MAFDLTKLKSISVGSRTRDRIAEGRDPATGERWKSTTDELNNTVTERAQPGATGVSHRQDVEVRPETVHYKVSQ